MVPFNVLNSKSKSNKLVKAILATSAAAVAVATPIPNGEGKAQAASSPAVKSMTIEFDETSEQTRTKTITIPNLKSIEDISVDTGKVEIVSINGDQVTLRVKDGNYVNHEEYTDPKKYSKEVTKTEKKNSNSFAATIAYSDEEGYTGNIGKSGSVSSKVISGSYTPADSKYVTGQTSSYYNSGGYSGTLSQYLFSGSYTPGDTQYVDRYAGNDYYASPYEVPSTKYFGPNDINYLQGYSGTLSLVEVSEFWGDRPFMGVYSGYVSKPAIDTRVYRYQGTVTKPASDTRVWEYSQDYKGTVYKPGTSYRNETYAYNVTIDYIDNSDPSGSVNPSNNLVVGNGDTITISGSKYDPDNDKTSVKIKLDDGTAYTLVEESSDSKFNKTFNIEKNKITLQEIGFDQFLSEGNHVFTLWIEDDKGGKSPEYLFEFTYDKFSSIIKDPGNTTTDDLIDNGIENVIPDYEKEYQDALEQYQEDKGSDLTKEDVQLVIDAINAVKKAEKNPTYENIDSALNLVNKLVNGKLKDSLNDRLKVLVKAPSSIKTENVESTTADIKWDASFDGATYIVKRDGLKVYEGKALSFSDKGLTPNKLHRYSVSTKIQKLESTETETTALTKANPVRNIVFSEIDHQGFRVTWDANGNTNGTRYQVLVKDGDKVKVDSEWITNLSGTAYNLEPGKSYKVEIRAKNDEGIETEAVSKQVTVLDYIIDEIQNLRVSEISSKKVTLEWDHNQPDIEFIIEKSRGNIQSPTKIVEGNKFEDTDLQVGKEYTYNVIARNKKYGTKSQAATVTVKVPLPDAPTAVQNLKYDQLENGSYKFTWDAVEEANLYYFEIYDGSTRKVFKSTKDLEVTTDKLEQGKTYSASVYAIDVYGQQTKKTTIEVKTNDLPPVANITDFNAKVDKTTLTLSWEKVNGAYGYYVEKYVDGQRKTRKYVTETSYQEEVTPGTYEYRIQTYHSSGMLEPVSKTIIVENPKEDGSTEEGENGKPNENELAVKSTVEGSNVLLTWNDVPDRYGFYVERYLDGKRQFRKYSSTPSFEDKNVAAGQYEYRIIAYTKAGMQDPVSHTVQVGKQNPDTVIEEVSAVVNGQNVEISWNNVDKAYYYYIERYDKNGNRNYRRSVSTNSYIDENVSNGEYEYKVIAYTPSGFQDPVTKKVQVGKPLENVTLDDFEIKVEGQTVTINWEKLDDIYGYYIERHDSKGNRNFRYSLNADQTEYVDSNVPYGDYQYKVIVYSKTGDMNPTSKTVSIEAPNDTLDSFDIEVEGKNVKLSWEEVPNTYYYYVERYRDGKREIRKTTSSTQFIDENVAEGDYEYRVIVYSKINGMQDPVIRTIKVGPETPDENGEQTPNANKLENVEVKVEGNKVVLNWNKVDNIYNYYIQRYKDGRRQLHISTGLETTFTDENLADGEYEYHVFVYDKNGFGQPIVKTINVGEEIENPNENETPEEQLPELTPSENTDGENSSEASLETVLPQTIQSVNNNVNGQTISLEWDNLTDVYGYYVEVWKDGKKQIRKYTNTNSFTHTVSKDGEYQFKIIVYSKTSRTMLSPYEVNITVGGELSSIEGSANEEESTNDSALSTTGNLLNENDVLIMNVK